MGVFVNPERPTLMLVVAVASGPAAPRSAPRAPAVGAPRTSAPPPGSSRRQTHTLAGSLRTTPPWPSSDACRRPHLLASRRIGNVVTPSRVGHSRASKWARPEYRTQMGLVLAWYCDEDGCDEEYSPNLYDSGCLSMPPGWDAHYVDGEWVYQCRRCNTDGLAVLVALEAAP